MSEKLPPLPPLDKPVPHPWEAWGAFGAFPVANAPAELVRAELVNAPVTLTRLEVCDPAKPADEAAKVISDG